MAAVPTSSWLHLAHGQHRCQRARRRQLLAWQPFANDVGIDAEAKCDRRHRSTGLQALSNDLTLEFAWVNTARLTCSWCRRRHSCVGVRLFHSGRDLYRLRSTPQERYWSDLYGCLPEIKQKLRCVVKEVGCKLIFGLVCKLVWLPRLATGPDAYPLTSALSITRIFISQVRLRFGSSRSDLFHITLHFAASSPSMAYHVPFV
jgi:hypothetical protein